MFNTHRDNPAKVLHLFNLLGAASEQTWLDVALRLEGAGGYGPVLGYESLAAGATLPEAPCVRFGRVQVGTVAPEDVPAQMAALANDPAHPLQGVAAEREIGLVHGHTGPRVLQAAPLVARGVPSVVSLYGYDASRLLRDPAWPARYRWAAERGTRFVVLCRAMAEKLLAVGVRPDRVTIIPLGIDPGEWPFVPMAAPAEPRFVFVGRDTPKKGLDDLLAAWPSVRAELGGRSRLDIVGAEASASREVAGVSWLGARPRAEVLELMRGATAFVLPSKTAPDGDSEGTPIVLMEAQALGVPCVTTRHMGNPDVVAGTPAADLLVPEANPARLAESLVRVARLTPRERGELQQAGRRNVEANFDLDRTVENYARLYRELMGSRPM